MQVKSKRHLNSDGELILRCSSLGDCMASPKDAKLSAGAITYVKNAFKETYLGYVPELEGKELDKGKIMEVEAIKLLSLYYEEPYVKNNERRSNGYISGECDIEFMNKIRDVKCPWSKKTHPLLPEDGKNTKYEWQLRGYMWLWNNDEAYLDYTLMNTPPQLIPKWEPLDIHQVDDLNLALRITTLKYERDLTSEHQIIQRIKGMRLYWNELKKHFKIK